MSQRPIQGARPHFARVRRRALLALAFVLTLAGAVLVQWSERPVARAVRAENPLQSLMREAVDAAPLIGRVVERLDAGSYTYLALKIPEASTPAWVVTLGDGQRLGSQVKVRSFGRRRDFYSRRLDRTFPELVFGIVSKIP
jgi:hypothetical protein